MKKQISEEEVRLQEEVEWKKKEMERTKNEFYRKQWELEQKYPNPRKNLPTSPLQKAQRKRSSITFVLDGAMRSVIRGCLQILNDEILFTDEEIEIVKRASLIAQQWESSREARRDGKTWQKVKEKLAASVDKQ